MSKTNTRELKEGDLLSRISFMKVTYNNGSGIGVANEEGFEWSIGSQIVANECYSTQFEKTENISRTALAEMLMSARDAIVVVDFNKQATADTVHAKLTEADGSKVTKKMLAGLLKGESRTMTGYVIGAEPILGRTIMIDLEKKKVLSKTKDGVEWDSRQRQVDHRTLNSVIYKNVKYIVK